MLVNVILLVITLTHHLSVCQETTVRQSASSSSPASPSPSSPPSSARSLPPTGGNVNRCSGQWRFPANCRAASCQYLCQWKFNHERDQVDFTLSTNRPDKWVGVGFSRDSKMPGTDVIVAWVEPGSRYVMMDAWLDSYALPIPDTKQSVQNISAAAANGLISFSFSRPLKTGDETHDLDFDECLHFVFPVGGGPVDTKQRLVMKHERTPMISPNKLCFNSCRPKATNSTPSLSSTTPSVSSSSPSVSSSNTPSTRSPYTRTRIRTTSSISSTSSTAISTEAPTTKYSSYDSNDSNLNDKLKKKVSSEGQTAIVTKEDELLLNRKKNEGGLNQATSIQRGASSSDSTSSSSSSSKEKVINQPDEGEEGESITDCKGEWKYPSRCTGYGCDYKAIWEYIDDLDEIMFTVSTKNRNKWTGIGFSSDKSMPGTDAVLGLVEESGRFFLMDTYLRSYSAPPLDSVQNIHNMSVWRENGVTTLQFNRKRKTGDRNDFQFSDLNCPYFVFPVQGGVFNAINKRLRKHEETPIVSSNKICVKSCKSKSSTLTTSTRSTTTSVQSSSTTSRPPSTVSTSSSSTRAGSSSSTTVKQKEFDVSQLGPNFPDLNKLSQGSKIDFSNVTAILNGMNLSSSDIPNLLKTFASKFPRNESSNADPSSYFSLPPFVTSSTPSSSTPKTSSEFGGHDDTNTKYDDTPAIVVSAPTTTAKPVYKRISPRTRSPSRWSTTSTTTQTPTSTASETTEEGEDEGEEEEEASTGNTSTTVASVQNEIEPESNYVVELKLPKAWKSVYARKKSEEYKTFTNHVEDEISKELRDRFSNLEVKVMELKSALDSSSSLPPLLEQQHSLIAKLKLKITPKVNSSSVAPNEVVRSKGESANNRSPEIVKEALNLAIKDGRLGDFSVDSSYLIIRPLGTFIFQLLSRRRILSKQILLQIFLNLFLENCYFRHLSSHLSIPSISSLSFYWIRFAARDRLFGILQTT